MKRTLTLICLGLNLLCIFIIFFEQSIVLPSWMSYLGRLHPVILHAPIGIVIVLLLFYLIKDRIEKQSSQYIFDNLILVLAFFSVISAFAGLVLSFEAGYEKDQIKLHKYTGIAVSVLIYMIYEFRGFVFRNKKISLFTILTTFGLMAFVGHLGGSITHGEDFLFPNAKKAEDDPTVFGRFVNPILQEKCKSCHNPQKTKGKLDMTTIAKLKLGGKNGKIWVGFDTLNSHVLERAYLDLGDKKHMPPKGKPQLTKDELLILKNWIAEGANYEIRLDQLKSNSYFYKFASAIAPIIVAKTYDFSPASESTINELSTPFCTLKPLSNGSPALKVNFYVSTKFDKKTLESLNKVKDQLVSVNLSKMPVGDEVFDLLSQFQYLEYLNLNQTNITGLGIEKLLKCKNLEKLALSNTKITFAHLEKILKMPSLKQLYIWETKISKEEIDKLKKGKIGIEIGYVPDETEILRLNPPILVNESSIIDTKTAIIFKHTLKDVNIRYTTDGSDPDSLKSPLYSKPIFLDKYGTIKFMATKVGWLTSETKQIYFFKSSLKPSNAKLLSPADPKYLGNGERILIDSKQGDASNFGDKSWMGFRDNNFECVISFDKSSDIKGFTMSYAEKTDSFIMPPEWIDVWIKEEGKEFVHLRKLAVPQLSKMGKPATKGLDFTINLKNIKEIRIVAKPLAKLPSWHPSKGSKAWLFVDEIFFY